ncbi:MAG: hypothetical protein ACOZB0_04755 [Pseudomonadota bacterium]
MSGLSIHDDYAIGFDAGWDAVFFDECVGDLVGASEDYDLGYWNGVGDAEAWKAGWRDAGRGAVACPYTGDADVFRDMWRCGYVAAFQAGYGAEVGHG